MATYHRRSDRSEAFLCCKTGDLSRLQYLVETKEVEVNIRDKWDSTLLYYACLCGHKEVVSYLLENGAQCEAKTFDGERCLYGALTDEIRDMLKSRKVVKTGKARRDGFQEFLRRLLEGSCYDDIVFVVHEEVFPAHRCILHARSPYFADMLETKWKHKSTINIKHTMVRRQAFRAILQYIYTGYLEVHLDCYEDCQRFAKQCQMTELLGQLESKLQAILQYVPQKPGTQVSIVTIEPSQDSTLLHDDLQSLADMAVPSAFCQFYGPGILPFCGEVPERSPFADVCFSVEGQFFYCHKVFFCCRSEYFRALLSDHFSESVQDPYHSLPVVKMNDIKPQIFAKIVYYIYSERVELTEDTSYDVLCFADLYLLPGLKRICANVISSHLTEDNVISVLRVSRMFSLSKLEDQCTEYMARHLEKFIESEEFQQLILEDAAEITNREETDSIIVVDDIRHHISRLVETFSEMEEAQCSLHMLDVLLLRLGLDC
ncbi:ankyrin repeat and BTB/POZ domain-containing protein 1-like [Acanthaster planci]|uniref:Ankyrin repeat and BTB/POZ domain-containing protein 1-like n=1 Tax=Acanthaster planci TaxID=133434 RepID=A0A8B7XK57_ACAPL|nr:ankyrin repeat and BTB/POZ domain-containing protein 1-like [Acanthaster planci]